MQEHIIIDGWNVIHAHPQLKNVLATESDSAARSMLRNMLAPVHDYRGCRLTIVYDGNGEEISIVRENKLLTFSEVYTPSFLTADELIEQLCATAKHPDKITVVTADNLLRLTSSSFGAISISPDKILDLAKFSSIGIRNATNSNNRSSALEWKKQNPFANLDALVFDISEIEKTPLISKRLKKKLKKTNSEESKKSI